MPLVGLIVFLIVIGLLLYLIQLLPIDATIKQIIYVIVIVAVILWLLSAVGLFASGPYLRLR